MDHLSNEEYLALERSAESRSEYIDGRVVPRMSGNWDHALIIGNLASELNQRLKSRPFLTFMIFRVRVPAVNLYAYPDVLVVSDEPLFEDEHQDSLLNPTLIVEVLSPLTEAYDRGRKFEYYGKLESLKEYILVAQDKPRVEHYLRQDSHVWLYKSVAGLEGTLSLSSIRCEVPLAEIYEKVDFAD
ncbi:MAG TPA: Uma2 family endonuclease [Thermoanaerobaculia bacterium]|nr:Uma2 family endonuclease [Thermoanaerobaculia bacterium]